MADMQTRRPSGRALPYVVAGVALLLIAAAVVRAREESAHMSPGDVVIVPPANTILPLTFPESRRFAAFADSAPDFGDMNRAHEYTRNGLRYLAAALQELAGDSSALAGRIAALREGAEGLSVSGASHARMFAGLAAQSADAIADLQRRRLGYLGAGGITVRVAADAVDGDKPLLQQKETVRSFFRAASSAVLRMGASAPSEARR